VQGDVDNRRASTFKIFLKKSEERHYGLRLNEMVGEWPGGDTMRLTGTLQFDRSNTSTTETGIWIDDAGQRHRYDRADQMDLTMPVTFTLRRGSEKDFFAVCRR